MAIKREERALRDFKHIIGNVVYLLKRSIEAETVYMQWVNRSRRQFVIEAKSTSLSNVMFQDRVEFKDHFLDSYKDIQKITQLEVGKEIAAEDLNHYHEKVDVRYLTLIPFVNNDETVAITVLESSQPIDPESDRETIQAYRNGLTNVLNTYLELTDLYDRQKDWVSYEESLNELSPRLHKVDILNRMLNEMQGILPTGGVFLVARGMGVWTHVLSSKKAVKPPPIGLMIDENSIAYDALQKGEPEFAIHFNQSPKRLATGEPETEGATLAIPLMIEDRRHGVVVAYDRNALAFKESTIHQLTNLVRIAGLMIRINLGNLSVDQDLLTSEYGSFIPDLWESTLESVIDSQNDEETPVWFGMITIENHQSLRSRYRLEDLHRLQKSMVKALNPSRFGFNGYIGFNSDYVFPFILQGSGPDDVNNWMNAVQQMLENPIALNDGQKIDVSVKAGYTRAEGMDRDTYDIVKRAKSALTKAMNEESGKYQV